MSLIGDYDVLAKIVLETPEELYKIFAEKTDMIEGIGICNMHMVMREFKK